MNTILLYIHLASLALAVYGIVTADHAALNWMRGKTEVVSSRTLFTTHWIVTTGLLALVYSGLLLFWPLHTYLITQPYFITKMAFVFALLINGICIEWLMHVAAHRSYASLNQNQKLPLLVSGGVSTLSWLGAATMAILQFGWLF